MHDFIHIVCIVLHYNHCILYTAIRKWPLAFCCYDTRYYFNVRSKADISQLNLPHGTDN